MNKRIIAVLLALLMLVPVWAACSKNKTTPVYIEGYDFVVKFGSSEIRAEQINSTPDGDKVVVYTRDYKKDGKASVVVSEEQEGRTAVVVRYISNDKTDEFDIVQITTEIKDVPIPVNGFALTLPTSMLEGVRANVGQIVKVEGYASANPQHERHDLASIAPDYLISTATRRVNIVDPIYGFVSDKIYYVTDKYKGETNINVDNVVVSVEIASNYSCNILSIESKNEITTPEKGKAYLVFTGEYNIAYANQYFNNAERISFSMLDKANSYSDMPSVVIDSGVIEIKDELLNVETITDDGVYVFDNEYSASVTPATDKKRYDVVVVDGIVTVVAEENARTLIPDGNGFVISLVGDESIRKKDEFVVGKELKTFFIDFVKLPEKYVEFDNLFVGIDYVNISRNKEGIAVLYTPMFGKSTNTNEYGAEIVIVDGNITAVNYNKGNTEIPENGYVLSVHRDNQTYSKLKDFAVGDKAEVSLTGSDYSVAVLKYDGVNVTRLENMLIVYNNKTSSGANEYGYEIAVDKDGYVVNHSYNGNIAIPNGGFALSGHGTNKEALEAVFAIGERVILDSKSSSVTVIRTPEQKLSTAKYEFDVVSDRIEAAKKAYTNLNYTELDASVKFIEATIAESQAAFESYDFETALAKAESVINTCDNLHYATIESKGVENRAVWYRSTEKSDEDVRATVEKMKALNVNALYLETWYEGYCIGKKVEVEGVTQNAYNGDYDALEGFIRICHEYDIEVHAWVHDFFVGYYYEGGNKYYNPYFDSFKDKYLIDCKGRDFFYYSANNNYFIFLNANDRECRDYILSIYEELITKYDLDGLHLDYIRFPELNYGTDDFGYNQDIIDAFHAKTGYTGDPRNYANNTAAKNAWIQFRCDIITSFAGEVYDLVRDVNPDIWLSCATYPDIALSKNTIAQDVRSFATSGYFDEIFSMSYGVNNATVVSGVKEYVSVTNDKTFYSSGIAAFLETTQKNFADQLTLVEQVGADGVSVFALASITPESYYYQMTLGAFRDPAVQTYYGSETVSAQMDYISSKLDNLSPIFVTLTSDDIISIKAVCSEIKDYADSFSMDNATYYQKINWCNSALQKIATAKASIVADCGDNAETDAIISDLEDLEYWLRLSVNRFETRK